LPTTPSSHSMTRLSQAKHGERESLAATIKGLGVEEHLRQKNSSATRDPADDFAAWHERFRHELASEFGDVPSDDDAQSIKKYIQAIKEQIT
jgi:hypothetical protein